uniref:Uncharacterized protein n=1 Tax=viral metagenome TaxID=1070528 RepID=A0A6M3XS80_9ZZZZ
MELTEKEKEALIRFVETVLGGARVQEYHEIYTDLAASTGTNTKDFTTVHPRRLRVITHVAAVNNISSCTFIILRHIDGGQTAIDKTGVAPLIGETVNWDGFMILGEGDYTEVEWQGCTSGDDIYAVVSGYEIIK